MEFQIISELTISNKMFFLRKKITGNIYVNEEISGRFEYKFADTVEYGYEEAHTVGDTTTEAECVARWGADAVNETLEFYKQQKFKEINDRSGELILTGGHEFPPSSGNIFSLSENAQINILGAERKKDVSGILPLVFNTMDDLGTWAATTASDVDDFFMNALVAKKNILDAGTVLKDQIRIASTKIEVDAVIDNR
jgi:hypothetical protein